MTTAPVHSITDEQIAEIEKAAKDKKAEGFLLTHNLSCDNLIALVWRLREAEKDAARYRWLRDKQTFIWMIQDWFPDDNPFTSVDTAIDTAMQEHTK